MYHHPSLTFYRTQCHKFKSLSSERSSARVFAEFSFFEKKPKNGGRKTIKLRRVSFEKSWREQETYGSFESSKALSKSQSHFCQDFPSFESLLFYIIQYNDRSCWLSCCVCKTINRWRRDRFLGHQRSRWWLFVDLVVSLILLLLLFIEKQVFFFNLLILGV